MTLGSVGPYLTVEGGTVPRALEFLFPTVRVPLPVSEAADWRNLSACRLRLDRTSTNLGRDSTSPETQRCPDPTFPGWTINVFSPPIFPKRSLWTWVILTFQSPECWLCRGVLSYWLLNVGFVVYYHMDPWPSFYFAMVATVIFSLVFIGADALDPLHLFAQLCSSSGQVRKLILGKVPSLISGRMARAWDLSAVVELGRQTWEWVRNASMCTVSVYAGPALFFFFLNLFFF